MLIDTRYGLADRATMTYVLLHTIAESEAPVETEGGAVALRCFP